MRKELKFKIPYLEEQPGFLIEKPSNEGVFLRQLSEEVTIEIIVPTSLEKWWDTLIPDNRTFKLIHKSREVLLSKNAKDSVIESLSIVPRGTSSLWDFTPYTFDLKEGRAFILARQDQKVLFVNNLFAYMCDFNLAGYPFKQESFMGQRKEYLHN